MAIITMENLKYKYPGTDHLALNGITLSIEKGEFIGIVGQNGAGKSTLCQAIIGLVPQFYHGAYGGCGEGKGTAGRAGTGAGAVRGCGTDLSESI